MRKLLARSPKRGRILGAMLVAAGIVAVSTALAFNPDAQVTVGSPTSPFSQNKQNEPAIAVDANHPEHPRRRGERQHRHGGVQRRRRHDLPVHAGRRRLGRLLLVRQRTTWTQPTYTGLTARDCLGVVGELRSGLHCDDRPDRHAAVVRRERPRLRRRPGGRVRPAARTPAAFSWANGSRLYYANLTSNVGRDAHRADVQGLRGDRRLAHRQRRRPPRAATRRAWSDPVLDLEAVVDDVLRQGADLGRQRVVEPVLRHGLRLLGLVRGPGEGQRGAGAAAGRRLARRRRHVDSSTRSARRPTTASATRPTAARSAPTATGTAYVFGVGTVVVAGGKQRVRAHVDARPTAARPGPSRRPSPGRSPSRASSTRCRAGRRSTASPARAATSRRRRASTSPTAPRPAPTRRTAS